MKDLRALWPFIDSKGPTTIKAQKRSKEISKIIHVTSGVQSNFMKLWKYFLYAKKTKIATLFNSSSPLCQRSVILESIRWTETAYSSVSAAPCGYVFYVYLCFDWNENSASGMRLTQKSARSFRPADILQNGATLTRRRQFFFFCAQKVFS